MRAAASIISCIIILLSSCTAENVTPSLRSDLAHLDDELKNSESITAQRIEQISTLSAKLNSNKFTAREQYQTSCRLFDLCYPFRFEHAMDALNYKERAAQALGKPDLITQVTIQKAKLLTSSGVFLEASQIMESIDSCSLKGQTLIDWYEQMERFYQDYGEYNPEIQDVCYAKAGYYRGRLIDSTPENSWLHRMAIVRDHINNGLYLEARDSSLALLSNLDRNSHSYAISSYYAAVACQNAELDNEALHWWIESAICDLRNSVKDYASLSCIALELFGRKEIDRAFRYMQTAMADAQFYNSKLRPLQIASNLSAIEESYNKIRDRHSRTAFIMTLGMSLLLILSICALVYVLRTYHRMRESRKELAELNLKLQETLSELSEANTVKAEYIGLFLSMCSNYLGKLKKIYTREQMDAELKSFYSTFDNAFIQLYPDFVSKFNALLREDSRIELKKGEMLNTELRIFALIKLGITQSSHIASLLRYSVNTIYNYRAQIKNAALDDRDDFEEKVRNL